MKKYIYMMLVVLTAGLASCSNDDISMEENVTKKIFETTFIVDPSGVVEPYRFESYAGELSIIPSEAQLRLRVLIYNSDGELVDMVTHKQANYQSSWSVKTQLEAGEYNALAISDVINTNDPEVQEYWILKDYEIISKAKLEKETNFFGYQKEILGICHVPFSVTSTSDVLIDLKPAGAACYFTVLEFDAFSTSDIIWFNSNAEVSSIFWDNSFNLNYKRNIENYINKTLGGISLGGYTGMHFIYLLPSKDRYFMFTLRTSGQQFGVGSQICIPEIRDGEQYLFVCGLSSEFDNYAITYYDNVTGKTFDEWAMEEQKLYSNSDSLNICNKILTSLPNAGNAVYIKSLIDK